MKYDLTASEVEVIKTSLNYSKQRIEDEAETPYEVKKKKLEELESVRKIFFKINT